MGETTQTLFWASLGLISLDNFELAGIKVIIIINTLNIVFVSLEDEKTGHMMSLSIGVYEILGSCDVWHFLHHQHHRPPQSSHCNDESLVSGIVIVILVQFPVLTYCEKVLIVSLVSLISNPPS